MTSTYSWTGDLSTHTTSLRRPTGHLCSNRVLDLPGTLTRESTSSTDIDPDQISWNDTGPDQTSPIDVGLGPNISNIRWSWVNSIFPPPQIPLRRPDWSQQIQALVKYLQQPSGLRRYLSGCKHLTHQTPRLYPTLPNRSCGPKHCLQPLPQLHGLLSTNARAFETGAVTPPKLSEILTPGGPLTRLSESFSIIMIDWLILIFYNCATCTLLLILTESPQLFLCLY